jgi:hypothetical protein
VPVYQLWLSVPVSTVWSLANSGVNTVTSKCSNVFVTRFVIFSASAVLKSNNADANEKKIFPDLQNGCLFALQRYPLSLSAPLCSSAQRCPVLSLPTGVIVIDTISEIESLSTLLYCIDCDAVQGKTRYTSCVLCTLSVFSTCRSVRDLTRYVTSHLPADIALYRTAFLYTFTLCCYSSIFRYMTFLLQ